jgi:hypothetical protein
MTRRALDQSSRYADLSLDEERLIKNGKHVLVAYIMKPMAGYDYLATAARTQSAAAGRDFPSISADVDVWRLRE